ncbi:MAG: serine/threonine-protein kinase [bacterium]
MLVCPVCARIYDESTTLCLVDGTFLRQCSDPRTGTKVGNYLLMGPLGEGGMGQVYRGEHVVIGKEVAIKVLRQTLAKQEQVVKRFLMEARAASMIRHPNIVDVTDFGQFPDGCSFFVMEFLDGPDLAKAITREGRLPLYRAVNILTQVSRALHACHIKGIAHRDLKPENIILLAREGRRDIIRLPSDPSVDPVVESEGRYDEVKILDFGIAKIQETTAVLDHESMTKGLVFGSPYYLSPEQATGKPGDHRSDIYALGVIFFEMLTGDVPFGGDTAADIMRSHLRDPVPSMADCRPDLNIPDEAQQLVQRAMAKTPQDRQRSAAVFLEQLSNCFGDVIYGRDIDRYLKAQKKRTLTPGELTSLGPPPLASQDRHVQEELGELFAGKYEDQQPITSTTLAAIVRDRPAPAPPPERRRESDDVASELEGLFPSDD